MIEGLWIWLDYQTNKNCRFYLISNDFLNQVKKQGVTIHPTISVESIVGSISPVGFHWVVDIVGLRTGRWATSPRTCAPSSAASSPWPAWSTPSSTAARGCCSRSSRAATPRDGSPRLEGPLKTPLVRPLGRIDTSVFLFLADLENFFSRFFSCTSQKPRLEGPLKTPSVQPLGRIDTSVFFYWPIWRTCFFFSFFFVHQPKAENRRALEDSLNSALRSDRRVRFLSVLKIFLPSARHLRCVWGSVSQWDWSRGSAFNLILKPDLI